MQMRLTNMPFQTTCEPLRPNSTGESLNILEKNHKIDLTGFVIMCLDVWYGKTANGLWFTRCGVNVTTFRIMDWSKNLGPICNDDKLAETTLTTTIRKWDAETWKDIEVEFIDANISDVNDMISWLRIEKDIFYTPPKERKADEQEVEGKIEPLSSTYYCCDMKLVTETQRLQDENKKLKTQLAAKIMQINEMKRISKEVSKDKDALLKFRSEIVELSGLGLLCGTFDENSKKIVDAMKALREFRTEIIKRAGVDALERDDKYILKFLDIKLDHSVDNRFIDKVYELAGCVRYSHTLDKTIDELKKKLKANDFYIESEWEADYRKFVQQIFEAVGTPCYDEVIHTNYLAMQALEAVKAVKAEHDDARGLSLKIEELEEKLRHAAAVEVWYHRTDRELAMERDKYRDICDEKKRDLREWAEWFDKVCEELDTPERDPEEVFSELRGKLIELDELAEFKAKLAEIIKLPEDKKRTATTRDYISSFEHTKKEWRKMEIKLANYERENKHLLERNHVLSASNGAMDVLRSIHGSIIGLCDIDDSPQIIGARIIDKSNRVKAENKEFKTDYANAKCARAELAWVYKEVLNADRLDPSLSPHEIAVRIRKRMRELEQKLEDIKDICDGDTDVMNIIG